MKNKHQNNGHFGLYGGRYVPEMLIPALEELEKAYTVAKKDDSFQKEFTDLLNNFAGRPTPLVFAENLTKRLGGAKIYLKNEGANLTGAHKITHCIGQALVAKKIGFSCTVYMGEVDIQRQRQNVFLMEQLGATVVPVAFGSKTLKDAVNAAIKDWIENVKDTHYVLGSVVGPHPFPTMNRDFQTVVGKEIRKQISKAENKLPDVVIACVGGGSNAMGAFTEFIKESSVHLVGVEAGGRGKKIGEHATRFPNGSVGIIEGYKSYFLQNNDGQLQKTHSISAGLDYPGIGPELSHLHDTKRVEFVSVTDEEALKAVQILAQLEGIIPALESAHAVSYSIKTAPKLAKNKVIVVNLSGRGDKDIFILTKA